jgi:hypothetical protein
MVHKWGWTAHELAELLRSVGFRKVKVRPPEFHKPMRDMRLEARK